jgi:hypothetical protein
MVLSFKAFDEVRSVYRVPRTGYRVPGTAYHIAFKTPTRIIIPV